MRKIFISPHNDDEVLFGAFTIMRHRKDIEVVIVYDSYVQPSRGNKNCTVALRRQESLDGLAVMGINKERVKFLGLNDMHCNGNDVGTLIKQFSDCRVWSPAYEDDGNRHHNIVAQAVTHVMQHSPRVDYYMTYTGSGKSTSSFQVPPDQWSDVQDKLRAMACYSSQIEIPDCRPHFLRSQEEYYVP